MQIVLLCQGFACMYGFLPGRESLLKFHPGMDIIYLNNIPLAYLYFLFNSFGYNLSRTSSAKASFNNFSGISLFNVYQSYVDSSLQKIDFLSRNGNVSVLPIMKSYNWFASTFLSQKASDNNFFYLSVSVVSSYYYSCKFVQKSRFFEDRRIL